MSTELSAVRSPTPSEAEAGPETARSQLHAPARHIPRSCNACHRRKVRCDKKEPCTRCAQASKPCIYPPKDQPARRVRKTKMDEVASRLSDLEKTLAAAADRISPRVSSPRHAVAPRSPENSVSRQSAITPYSNQGRKDAAGKDILVQSGSASHYFNEVLLSRVIAEVQQLHRDLPHQLTLISDYEHQEHDLRSTWSTPQSSSPVPVVQPIFSPLGIISSPCTTLRPSGYHPSSHIALRLWSIYINVVETGCGQKLLHIPTDEIKVCTTINDPTNASLDNLTLCFAVYYMAVVAIDEDEAQLIFGHSRAVSLAQFKTGLEQSFAYSDFFDNPTLTGLYALVIYMAGLRIYNRGKILWILNGLTIRIGQSLGLHRDGEQLGLSPFQSELRRRLWWQILNLESRAAEDYGLNNPTNPFLLAGAKLPLNVEDAELYPEMKELPVPKNSWTPMTFPILIFVIAKAMHELSSMGIAGVSSSALDPGVRERIISEMKQRVGEFLEYCNPVVPRQRLIIHVGRFMMRKLDLISRHQWLAMQSSSGVRKSFAAAEDFIEAIEILERGLGMIEDQLMKPYLWIMKAYPQYHVTLYLLWNLCVNPVGPEADRAWHVIEATLASTMGDGIMEGLGSKGWVLQALLAKAKSLRKRGAGDDAEGTEETQNPTINMGDENNRMRPDFGDRLMMHPIGRVAAEGFDIWGGCDEFPDWGELVQGLQTDGNDHFNVFPT